MKSIPISLYHIKLYNFLVGLCDASTGVLLLLWPGFTLELMLISEIPAELVFLRFIGAFVFGVGISYWIPFLKLKNSTEYMHSVITVWQSTAVVRAVVGLFVFSQIITSTLPLGWLSVALTDCLLSFVQIILVRRVAK